MLPEQRASRRFARIGSQEHVPDVRMMNAFREEIGVEGLRQVNGELLEPIIARVEWRQGAAALIDATDLPASCSGFKKKHRTYSAHRAALGGRTLKSGQSQCFVGYKKHTFRLWISWYERGVLLVPLVSWAAPANVSEGGMLIPSLAYCARRWSWWPSHVVADMGIWEPRPSGFAGRSGA